MRRRDIYPILVSGISLTGILQSQTRPQLWCENTQCALYHKLLSDAEAKFCPVCKTPLSPKKEWLEVFRSGYLPGRKREFAFLLHVSEFDDTNKTFRGEITWPDVQAVNRIAGFVSGRTVRFREVDRIRAGKSLSGTGTLWPLGLAYTLTLNRSEDGLTGACVLITDRDNQSILDASSEKVRRWPPIEERGSHSIVEYEPFGPDASEVSIELRPSQRGMQDPESRRNEFLNRITKAVLQGETEGHEVLIRINRDAGDGISGIIQFSYISEFYTRNTVPPAFEFTGKIVSATEISIRVPKFPEGELLMNLTYDGNALKGNYLRMNTRSYSGRTGIIFALPQ